MAILKLAVQKSGRLSEETEDLIRASGIRVDRMGDRLKAQAANFPLEIYYLRDDDIPEYVENGVADLGVVGNNIIIEQQRELKVLQELGFAKCRLSIAVPKEFNYSGVASLNGKSIATTYKNSLNKFLNLNKITANVLSIKGSTELAPSIGLADAVCDLVSSGSTLLAHGLKEVEVLNKSQAVLIAANLKAEKKELADKLIFRLSSVLRARDSKYILMNVPNNAVQKVIKLLPGLRSPTVLPLAEEGWSSVHTVINEGDFWERIDQLRQAGAEGILVSSIEKIIV